MSPFPSHDSENIKYSFFKAPKGDDITQLYDIRKLYLGIQRHLILILISALFCTGLGCLATYYQLTHYKANAAILFKQNTPTDLPVGITLTNPTLTTALDLITLEANYQAVIGQLGLNFGEKQLAKMIDVPTPTNNSHLIHIIAKSDHTNLAVDIANALAKIAVKRSQDFYAQQVQAELNNFKSQLYDVNQRLVKELYEIETFKKEHQYFEMTADYVSLISQLNEARNKLQEANLRYNSIAVEYENLRKAADAIPEKLEQQNQSSLEYSPHSGIDILRSHLAEARAKYSPENPKIKVLEDELKNALQQENGSKDPSSPSEPTYVRNRSREQLDFELLRMESRVQSAKKIKEDLAISLARLEKQLENLPKDQMTFAKLLRAKVISEEQVDYLNKGIKTFQLMLNVPSGALELYQLADNAKPLHDSILVRTFPIAGMILGMLLGIVLSVIAEMYDSKYRTLKQLEMGINIPALMVMPEFSFFTKKNSELKMLYYTRHLAERLETLTPSPSHLSIGFTSSTSHEGKSCLSHHLAHYYRKIGKSVLLMDMDSTNNPFNEKDDSKPIESYLEGTTSSEELLNRGFIDKIKTGGQHLFLKEMLKSKKMTELMDEMKQRYDILIMDIPGIIDTDYATNLLGMNDLKIFIIGSSFVKKKVVHESLRDLAIAGIKPTGLVLNRVSSIYIEDTRIKLETKRKKMEFWKNIFGYPHTV